MARRRPGIPDHRLNYVATRSAIEFGNSPFVRQHLRALTGRGTASVSPVRLQVQTEQRGRFLCAVPYAFDRGITYRLRHIFTFDGMRTTCAPFVAFVLCAQRVNSLLFQLPLVELPPGRSPRISCPQRKQPVI